MINHLEEKRVMVCIDDQENEASLEQGMGFAET